MKKFLILFIFASLFAGCNGLKRLEKQNLLTTTPASLNLNATNSDNPTTDVNFRLNIPPKYIPKRSQLVYTPQFINGTNIKELTPIVVQGKKCAKREGRAIKRGAEPMYEDAVYFMDQKEPLSVDYSLTIPVEDWMPESELVAETKYIDCSGKEMLLERQLLAVGVQMPQVQPTKPATKTVITTEEIKEESVTRLMFMMNLYEIDPKVSMNSENIAKIKNLLWKINSDSTLELTGIEVIGSASPDGTTKTNNMLAEKRGENVALMLENECNVSPSKIGVTSLGANWEGFIKLVEDSNMSSKSEIIKIAKGSGTDYQKTVMLRNLPSYGELKTKILPKLRCVMCDIHYLETKKIKKEVTM